MRKGKPFSQQKTLQTIFCISIVVTPMFLGCSCISQDSLFNKLVDFSQYDMNNDGINEIEYLNLLSFEDGKSEIPKDGKLIVVLVEPRLLGKIPNSSFSSADLLGRLQTYKADLETEGYCTCFIEAKVYDGKNHQDGRTVLAIRELFRDINSTYSNFQGAVLVGSFPEAMLVRTFTWEKEAKFGGETIGATHIPGSTKYLWILSIVFSHRADLVLADLDGNWENIYEEDPKELPSEVFASLGTTLESSYYFSEVYEFNTAAFEDFFWIKDTDVQPIWGLISTDLQPKFAKISKDQLNPEMNASDKALPNPIARPDIFVSRINARHIALIPDPNFTDLDGKKFLGSDGKPQAIKTSSILNNFCTSNWLRDAALEREILIDYFDRNHAFRTGGYSDLPFRTASISGDPGLSAGDGNNFLKKASSNFTGSVVIESATLLDYVNWLKQPAVFRLIMAHSEPRSSDFQPLGNIPCSSLDSQVGGKPWCWSCNIGDGSYDTGDYKVITGVVSNWVVINGDSGAVHEYEPSLCDMQSRATWHLHRTIWENQILKNTGANIFTHFGCEANSPAGAESYPYNSDYYGVFQNVESVMFYLNGVALIARAKVYYDLPSGLPEALEKVHMGSGWAAYFEYESKVSAWAKLSQENKRTYPWSILGDWTIRLRHIYLIPYLTPKELAKITKDFWPV